MRAALAVGGVALVVVTLAGALTLGVGRAGSVAAAVTLVAAVVGAVVYSRAGTGVPGPTAPPAALVGHRGTVVAAIPGEGYGQGDGYGQVELVVGGHVTRCRARGDMPLAVGTPVQVTAVLSTTAVSVSRL